MAWINQIEPPLTDAERHIEEDVRLGHKERRPEPTLNQRIIGAIREARAGWQPIESAPEGQDILLATASGYVFLAKWVRREDQWCKHGHSMPYLPNAWAHWRPLPVPPETGS